MTLRMWSVKMLASIVLDITDFFIPPPFETLSDLVLGGVGLMFWHTSGAIQFLEVLDPSGRIDAFVPSLTIAGLLQLKDALD